MAHKTKCLEREAQKTKTLETALEKKMQEPSFRAEYEALEPKFAVMQAIIDTRKNSGLTQKQLSEKTGLDQGDISKIERRS